MAVSISIVVPIYNVEKYIDECIRSIQNQDYHDYEIILVDDGTRDNCGAICDRYKEGDPKIVVVHKENGGLSSARNAGLSVAVGDFIMFLDGDDMLTKGCLKKVMPKIVKKQAEVNICTFNTFIDGQSAELSPFVFKFAPHIVENSDRLSVMAHLYSFGVGVWTATRTIYKREMLINNKLLYNTELRSCEDFDFHMNMFLKANSFFALNEPIFDYRMNRIGSLSTTKNAQFLRNTFKTFTKWIDYYSKIKEKESAKLIIRAIVKIYYGEIAEAFKMNDPQEREEILLILDKNKRVLKYVSGTKRKVLALFYTIFGFKAGMHLYKICHLGRN